MTIHLPPSPTSEPARGSRAPLSASQQASVPVTLEAFCQHTLDQVRHLLPLGGEDPVGTVNRVRQVLLRHWLTVLTSALVQHSGCVVQSGPFAGMKYVQQAAGAIYLPKVMGCYEAELHAVVRAMPARGYATIVNIGCGEGYYAVGLARLLPGSRVHAFDLDPAARVLCGQLGAANGVLDRLAIWGECRHEDLAGLAQPGALVFCDVEGAEETLLDPAAVPGLAHCDLLVETHDHYVSRPITELLVQRFQGTHDIQHIPLGGRDPNSIPILQGCNQLDQWLAVWEGRPVPTPWLWMTPRVRSGR